MSLVRIMNFPKKHNLLIMFVSHKKISIKQNIFQTDNNYIDDFLIYILLVFFAYLWTEIRRKASFIRRIEFW